MKINKFLYDFYQKSFKIYINKYQNGEECSYFYKTLPNNHKSIIWVHGFNDYFFHFHISNTLIEKGYNIFSINLRNYRDKEKLFYIDDLNKYIEDIEYLIEYINKNFNSTEILLYGHSMGGLICTIFCKKSKYKNNIQGLILNSPFFSFNQNIIESFFINYLIFYLGYFIPKLQVKYFDSEYKNYNSFEILTRFFFEEKFKLTGHPAIYAGWIRTIIENQLIIQNNFLNISIPIIVFHSNKTITENEQKKGDCVLNIEDIKKYSLNLGNNLTICEIKDGIHDIFCSEEKPLKNAIQKLTNWLDLFK